MTQAAEPVQKRRQEWIERVTSLANQVKEWCRTQNWAVEEDQKTIDEDVLGQYSVPVLRISVPGGTAHFNPIALNVLGGNGRIDLEAFPTLSRVKLVGTNGGWKVLTDSNVPLREPWSKATFVQLISDLMS